MIKVAALQIFINQQLENEIYKLAFFIESKTKT